jgi:hypothetical protein
MSKIGTTPGWGGKVRKLFNLLWHNFYICQLNFLDIYRARFR